MRSKSLLDPQEPVRNTPHLGFMLAPQSGRNTAARLHVIDGGADLAPVFEHNSRTQRIRAYHLLFASDLICIFLGFAIGALIRFGSLEELTWLRISLATVPLFILGAMHNQAYSLHALKSAGFAISRSTAALLGAFGMLFVVSYFLKAEQDVSRLGVGTGVIATLALCALGRRAVVSWVRSTFAGELTATIVIHDGMACDLPAVGPIVDAARAGLRPDARDPAMIQRLVRLLAGADRVIVVCGRELCSAWAAMLKGANVCGEILADEVQSVRPVGVGSVGDRTTLIVSTGPLSAQQRVVKRIFDLAIAIPAIIIFAPLLLALALAIKLDSRGPVLFKQQRVGFGNRFFNVYKFRSMSADASDALGTESTAINDARVTRVGAILRKTSLDELPQLINVVNGTMSLVGPRPHAIGSFAGKTLFWDVDDRYAHRHLLTPGITGLAQVRGFRGTAHQTDDLSRRLESDLEYMTNWSVGRDLMIILKTFGVLMHPNAY